MGAIYLDIKKDLEKKIKEGIYEVGQIIPAETQLAQDYGVSRPTVRQAISLLVKEGVLERKRKRGTIVCPSKVEQSFTEHIGSFDAQIHEKGRSTQTRVLLFQKEKVDETLSSVFDCEWVYKLVRLRYVDHQPNVYVVTYFPYALFSDAFKYDFSVDSFYEMCKEKGHEIKQIVRHLEMIKADDTLCDLLKVSKGDSLFYFSSVGKDEKGAIVEYSLSKYRGDTNTFIFSLGF